jgi:hypothetical protein
MMDDLNMEESQYGEDETSSILDSSMISDIHPTSEDLNNTLEILDDSYVG